MFQLAFVFGIFHHNAHLSHRVLRVRLPYIWMDEKLSTLLPVTLTNNSRTVPCFPSKSLHTMETPPKVNTEEEMRIALNAGARVIGINNRNLHTFELNLDTTAEVSKVALQMGVPWQKQQQQQQEEKRERIVLCALSGVKGPEDVKL